MMRFSVKTLSGKTIQIKANASTTVAALKVKLYQQEGYPTADQRLVFSGNELEDDHTLEKCHIEKASTVHLIGKLGRQTSKACGELCAKLAVSTNEESLPDIKEFLSRHRGTSGTDAAVTTASYVNDNAHRKYVTSSVLTPCSRHVPRCCSNAGSFIPNKLCRAGVGHRLMPQ